MSKQTKAYIYVIIVLILLHLLQVTVEYFESCATRSRIEAIYEDFHKQFDKAPALTDILQHLKTDSITDPKVVDRLSYEIARSVDAHQAQTQSILKSAEALVNNHITHINNQYSNITLWATVITIVFLIFSIYALFKQEKTLDESKKILELAREDAAKVLGHKEKIEKTIQEMHDKIREVNILNNQARKVYEEIKQESKTSKQQPGVSEELKQVIAKTAEVKTEKEFTANDWFLKGYEANKREENEEAITYYKKAVELDSNDPNTYYNLALSLHRLGMKKKDESLLDEAIQQYMQAILLNPNDVQIIFNWGCTLSELGKMRKDENLIEEAIEKYKIAEDMGLNNPNVYYNWGYSLINLSNLRGTLQESEDVILTILQKANNMIEDYAAYNMACLYSLLNDKDKAFKYLEKALQLNYDNDPKSEYENEPDLDNLKTDPRFEKLLQKFFSENEN